ncbi:acyltransferase family protein [Novosphingobium mangrovi (ex Hu et al. 2023)]|uniref:Acyltransferase n=1 Tax=Novosphingobium mangrovi (ex Hu et al. 2023) TaxID=2930094 RepID=A0ABT0A912_9SPHN|nr:acyltransferase [Novosphingobium mangrovi (ex Hu et al. 2023)]MCJ1959667.1 acyltransferase [Novosphingobium mangrovi (ex Hu et al. 2023)]
MTAKPIIKQLHGLRGVAAMSVVCGHFSPIPTVPAIGVVLFFIISGFLIGKLYLEKDFTFSSVWTYAVGRFARVYPLFALVVISVGLLNYLEPSADIFALSADQIVPHLLLAGAGHTIWTISSEFQFYAFFVLIWYAYAKARLPAMTILVPLLIAAIGVALWLGTSAGRINLFGYLPIFVLGLITARVTDNPPEVLKRWASAALVIAGLCYAVAFFAVPFIYDPRWIYVDPISILICATILGACIMAGDCLINRVLSTRVLVWLGEISFSIYLLHRVAQWLTEHTLGNTLSDRYTTPIMIALTIGMAEVTNRFVEKPARAFLVGVGRKIQAAIVPQEQAPASS